MIMDLIVLARSDKHNGYCVACINKFGEIVRLVRDSEGHALEKEKCKFKKLDFLTADVKYAPLEHQKENYILNKILNSSRSMASINDLIPFLECSPFIFGDTNPWLCEKEINNQKSTFLFVKVTNLHIYENDEGKYKCDFMYNNYNYKGFSITDPEFKMKNKKFSKAFILVSLPAAPYNRYGNGLYYKFICAVYPWQNPKKSYLFDCYKIH